MAYEIACRTGRLSALALSWPSRFCQDGEFVSLTPGAPRSDFHSEGFICSTKLTCPVRSNCADVVSCGTTRNTTFLKCAPLHPPQYRGKAFWMTSNSWPLLQAATV